MLRTKIKKDRFSSKLNLLIYRNYRKVDQIAKIYTFSSGKTNIVVFNLSKFKKYVQKGINFYNKKCLVKNFLEYAT